MAAPVVPESATPFETFLRWASHLMCFVMPLTTLVFAITGPHSPASSMAFLAVVVASILVDRTAAGATHQPARKMPGWPFNAVLYILTALQVLNVLLTARMMSMTSLLSVDMIVATLLVGINSGYSGIVVAHELMHRPQKRFQLMSRLLMCTVFYEHFFTEHVRGHHVRVGTAEDPATARFGETYGEFVRRTVPAQFRSAWRLEAKRLGDETMKWHDRRMLRSRVVHGIVAETALVVALGALFGVNAVVIFFAQAWVAVHLLEAVNYFEHYGLVRRTKRVRPIDSWDTDSWFSLYSLVGLSRHADHHAFASRPYQQLRHWNESPKLPYGYFAMVVMVIARNAEFRRLMEIQLRERRVGPFEELDSAPQASEGPLSPATAT